MFTLKQSVRRHAMVVAIAAVTVGFAAASQAAVLQWDPGMAGFGSPSGGSGDFNDVVGNFVNSDGDRLIAGDADDVRFGGTGGAVGIDAPVMFNLLTFNAAGYNFNTANDSRIVLSGSRITQSATAGSNTINTALAFRGGGTRVIEVAGSSILNIDKVTIGDGSTDEVYGAFQKTGSGLLSLGVLNTSRSSAYYTAEIAAGTLQLTGGSDRATNFSSIGNAGGTGGLVVGINGKFAGDAIVYLGAGVVASLQIHGHLSPGNNGNADFGAVGKLTLIGTGNNTANAGNTTTFNSTSNFNLDLITPTAGGYDAIELICGTYGGNFLKIVENATININNGTGSLTEGTYSIVTLVSGGTSAQNLRTITYTNAASDVITDFEPFTDANGFLTFDLFKLGNVPAGYDYKFQLLGSGTSFTGIDLVVSLSTGPGPGIVDNSGNRFSFGGEKFLSATSNSGEDYAHSSTIKATDSMIGDTGTGIILGTTASILGGVASSDDTVVTMTWRTRLADEIHPDGKSPLFAGVGSGLLS
ncbi:MAG: hypothetical protein FWD53_09660, partial [Phycisphaerales bacterium]|nr:hypothetical protein [Phycisphaerales bacterium]